MLASKGRQLLLATCKSKGNKRRAFPRSLCPSKRTSSFTQFSSAVLQQEHEEIEETKEILALSHQQEPNELLSTKRSTKSSPSHLQYVGNERFPITSKLHILTPEEDTPRGIWPVFRLMDEDGTFRDKSSDDFTADTQAGSTFENHDLADLRDRLSREYPQHAQEFQQNALLQPSEYAYADTLSDNTLTRAHRQIVRLREMDTILQNAQRQGRISFYMTCSGEESIHIGSASALKHRDVVLAQYREAGLLMWRGFTLEQFTDQCFSNHADLGKGRQMPVHYGSRALNYQTISSPLGTQIPQAVGAAYQLKLAKKDAVAACFFGDGCSSTTDFHSGLNFAATLEVPVLFLCRNNGYAISTSTKEQYRGDGIVGRAPGYGMAAIRVDGNDVFAVSAAVRKAREYALENSAPVLIEFISYRKGHHSTSDDSLRYRSAHEVQAADARDPLNRLEHFLLKHDPSVTGTEVFQEAHDEEKSAVLEAMKQAERKPDPPLEDLFTDVYYEMPKSLQEQEESLHEHLSKYPSHYS